MTATVQLQTCLQMCVTSYVSIHIYILFPKPERTVKYYEPAQILLLIPLPLTLLVIVTDSCHLFMSLTALILISGFNWKVGVGAWNTEV